MNEGPRHPTTSRAHAPLRSGGVVFWLLVLLGLSTFTPCVLLPEWYAYHALAIAHQAEQHRVNSLQQVVDREHRLLEALRSDQAVIDRLAQRDLNFQRAGERVVRVSLPVEDGALRIVTGETTEVPFVPEPVQPPHIVARLRSFLPDYNYEQVFCDDETRPIVMCMSVALICVAFGLFGRRDTRLSRQGR